MAVTVRLRRTVRNRWFFHEKEHGDFIPKFHVANPRRDPPNASALIEQGLVAAEATIDEQVSRALCSLATTVRKPQLAGWGSVRDYLKEHGLSAKLTDKNLGLAVFSTQWYDGNVMAMLADTRTYQPELVVPIKPLQLMLLNSLSSWRLPAQLDRFIRLTTKWDVPSFHAIPKVHKEPWRLRPIVPSHSSITSSVSVVLVHFLQPLLAHFPWVVASSKEVLNRIERLRVFPGDEIWFCTGDVVSCYTNIPPKPCAKTVSRLFHKLCPESTVDRRTMRAMIQFVLSNNFFEYRGKIFRQCSGLAMGTSCAPVLANLFMAAFEEKQKVVDQKGVLLYVRYIDHVFAVFRRSKEELASFQSSLSLGPLEVTWTASSQSIDFLDIEIYRRETLREARLIHTRIFRKAMNRCLYIPSRPRTLPLSRNGLLKPNLYGWPY